MKLKLVIIGVFLILEQNSVAQLVLFKNRTKQYILVFEEISLYTGAYHEYQIADLLPEQTQQVSLARGTIKAGIAGKPASIITIPKEAVEQALYQCDSLTIEFQPTATFFGSGFKAELKCPRDLRQ